MGIIGFILKNGRINLLILRDSMTLDEQNRLYLNLLARSMAEFPLWAQKCREQDGDTQDRHSCNRGCENCD